VADDNAPRIVPVDTSREHVVTSSDAKNEKMDRRGFEALAVILLSLATVGMAWCARQAAVCGTESTKLSIQSVTRTRDASNFRIKANQVFTLDIFLFSHYLDALKATNEPFADFYARQFSPELKHAYEAQSRSSRDSNTPADPFVKGVYPTPLLTKAESMESESERMWNRSLEMGKTGDGYTLISVLLATALFFSGTAPQFETQKKRRIVLMLGLATLLISIGMFITLPRPTGGWATSFKTPPEISP
jgi:hypothetical protein